MADGVTVKVDATRAVAKLGRITPQVRDSLRGVLPDLTRQLGALVNAKLASELKSHNTLTVTQELHESANRIVGVVGLESPSAGGLLPTYLEQGTRPHEIVGNPVLAFYWDKLNQQVFFHRVNHPGTKDYRFLERSLNEMRSEITEAITGAVREGARSA